MSAPLPGEPRIDNEGMSVVSRIKVVRNSKGDPQWEISVAEGATDEELDRLRILALRQHDALIKELLPQ